MQQALDKLISSGKQTVVVVTHVPSLLRQVDKVAVIQDGSLAKFGPRDEVMRDMMAKGRVAAKAPQAAE